MEYGGKKDHAMVIQHCFGVGDGLERGTHVLQQFLGARYRQHQAEHSTSTPQPERWMAAVNKCP